MKNAVWLFTAFLLVAASAEPPPKHQGPVTDIAIDPADGKIYSCSQGGVFQGNGSSLERICLPDFRVTSIVSAGSGKFILSGGMPGELGQMAVLNLATNELLSSQQISGDLIYSSASSDGSGFFALAAGGVIQTGQSGVHPRHRHTAATRSVRVTPNGRFLASAGMDRVVIISNLETSGEPVTIQDHTAAIDCLAFSPDSTQIASGARDGKVRIHAVPDGRLIRTYSNLAGEVGAIAWGGKPERLLAGTTEGRIYQLDLSNDTATVIEDWGTESPITALAIDSKGNAYAGTLNRLNPVRSQD